MDAGGADLSAYALERSATAILQCWQRQRWQPAPLLLHLSGDHAMLLRRSHGEAIPGFPLLDHKSTPTRARRDASLILSLPWSDVHGSARGLVTVEALTEADRGNPLEAVWPLLDTFTAVLGPHLDRLAPGEPGPAHDAPGIPVVGAFLAARIDAWRRFARCAGIVLIQSPTGTETRELAHWLHHVGPQTGPVIAPSGVVTARQLASAIHAGRGGTLILSEIESLTLDTQAVLLHFIEAREYVDPGANVVIRAPDLRLILIAHRELGPLAHAGRFHPTLQRQLEVFTLRLPPLAARRDETPAWARHALAGIDRSASIAAPRPALDRQALRRLAELDWPGNQQELNWVVRRAWFEALADAGATVRNRTRIAPAHIERALDVARGGGDSLLERYTRLSAELLLHPVADEAHDELMEFLRTQNLLFSLLWRAAARHYDGDRTAMAEALARVSALKSRNFQKELDAAHDKLCRIARFLGEPEPEDFNRPD